MKLFKKKEEELYLVTNFKVMFSTLKKQQNLERVFFSKELALKISLNQTPIYLLVRNPYNRIESFFKDKLRKNVRKSEKKRQWQNSQKIFFPYLELNDSMPPSLIAKKLLSVTFEEFISLLPEVYKKNAHLFPQYWTLNAKKGIQYKDIYKMESEHDLKKLAERFNIDLKIRANSTKLVNVPIDWRSSEISIIDKIYKNDFKKFNYKRKGSRLNITMRSIFQCLKDTLKAGFSWAKIKAML